MHRVTGREQQSSYPQKFAELTDNVLFGDMWTRPQLGPRERSLATVAALVALYRLGNCRSICNVRWITG